MINPGVTVEALQELTRHSLEKHLGIEFTEVGPDYLCARMPVDGRTRQPFGVLHGGASVVLAETLGSVGANSCVDGARQYCVGLEINANHVRSVREGYVYGRATALHVGLTTQVWEIRIRDAENRLVCVSRITLAVLDKK
ncbi:MAG: hotdog fold thioesterase [Ferruginibacter sp.]|nr:hotdog fold thioesterase [Cytophagales bacterium]